MSPEESAPAPESNEDLTDAELENVDGGRTDKRSVNRTQSGGCY
ncbi:unannotated protein [freshwater metagenome]|uniref:Unannotated protein n=1 Tax=freshwater metagenome TaxID=449393 RepID=A0A6J7DDD6_9ZZZZ